MARGHRGIASTLLELNVNTSLADAHGWTAAKLAEACGHNGLAQLLYASAAGDELKPNGIAESSEGEASVNLKATASDAEKHGTPSGARQIRRPFDSLPQARYLASNAGG